MLAALLQVAPMARTVCTSPLATSSFAIVLRWGITASAALGAFDSVSRASDPVAYTCPTSALGTVNTPFTFLVTISGYGSDPGAFFTNSPITPLPQGLSISTYDHYPDVYGVISGTPTTGTTNQKVTVICGFPGETPIQTSIYFTMSASSGIAPVITNHPSPQSVTAGFSSSFDVLAGGTAPLKYQWRRNGNPMNGATNSSYMINNTHLSDAGNYTVVVTNASGSITSNPALLTVNPPAAPTLSLPSQTPGVFQFSFTPAVGLTNFVLTNSDVGSSSWGTLTNIPPPASAATITISDTIGSAERFYRVKIDP